MAAARSGYHGPCTLGDFLPGGRKVGEETTTTLAVVLIESAVMVNMLTGAMETSNNMICKQDMDEQGSQLLCHQGRRPLYL